MYKQLIVIALMSIGQSHAASYGNTDFDKLFDWAQGVYATELKSPTSSGDAQGYRYRCYTGDLCLGVKDGQVYASQGGKIVSLGTISQWMSNAFKDQLENGKIFPIDLAASSPTNRRDSSSTTTKSGQEFAAFPSPSTTISYLTATGRINALLSGSAVLLGSFDPNAFLMQDSDAGCFGPSLKYTNHPDAATLSSGTLPTGDLGIWSEIDSSTGDACAAAQFNARMEGRAMRANMALIGLAGLLRAAYSSGTGLPAAGSSVDVTTALNAAAIPSTSFTTATLALDGTATTYTYNLEFVVVDSSGLSHTIKIRLTHTPGGSATNYTGLLTFSVTDNFTGGACGSGTNAVTRIGTFKYTRSGPTNTVVVMRNGQYCGTGTFATLGSFDTDSQLKATGWSDSFSRYGANYNPKTLEGYYLSAWQAGAGDSYSRILQLGLNGNGGSLTNDGEAYYGFAAPIDSTDGKILGFYCNWAGPKPASAIGLHKEYAQRQFVRFNATSNLWEQPTGGSDIRYAPTDACTYAGTGTFWYDRDLNGAVNETSSDVNVSTPDLMGLSTAATIADAIAARGYTIPSF